jgi:hypothetical protein
VVIAVKADADTACTVMIKRQILLLKNLNNINIMKSTIHEFQNKNILTMSKKYFFILMAAVSLGGLLAALSKLNLIILATANFANYKTYLLRTDDLKLNDLDKDRV